MQTEQGSFRLDISSEVQDALMNGGPVVALESTIISHGMPYPLNVETALRVEKTIRELGAVPATIAILGGRLKVGLSEAEIEYLGKKGQEITKTSRRDIPFMVSRQEDGATTVAATMIIAAMAGVRVFATGGIGGVHRGADTSMDISADLDELGRTDVAVVCAGVKSILDIGLTLEYLETKGVPVVGFQTDALPAFYTRDSGFGVDYRIDDPLAAATAMKSKWDLQLHGGMIITNPIPEEHALDPNYIQTVIDDANAEMKQKGISGKDATPFLLGRIAEQTDGKSLDANIQLVINNAALAAKIACAYSELEHA
jgi:pseudouridine-5'-phosphate glycosidase